MTKLQILKQLILLPKALRPSSYQNLLTGHWSVILLKTNLKFLFVLMVQSLQPALLISTTEDIPGRRTVEFYGVVTGNTVRAKHVGRDLMAGLKNIVGGELTGYTELLQDSREEATARMIEQARSMGANAVVNVRYATSSVAQGAAELFAYGTAVRVE